MYHHHITRAVGEGRAADRRRTAAGDRPVVPGHPRRAIVVALIASCALAPIAGARAQPADSVTAKWRAYDEQVANLSPKELAAAFGTAVPMAKVGDTPADFPNASRAPEYNGPATVEVVRPERTIVHDADQVLLIILAGLALLVALGGTAYTMTRSRTRAAVGRTRRAREHTA